MNNSGIAISRGPKQCVGFAEPAAKRFAGGGSGRSATAATNGVRKPAMNESLGIIFRPPGSMVVAPHQTEF